jgi:hypothetical protein
MRIEPSGEVIGFIIEVNTSESGTIHQKQPPVNRRAAAAARSRSAVWRCVHHAQQAAGKVPGAGSRGPSGPMWTKGRPDGGRGPPGSGSGSPGTGVGVLTVDTGSFSESPLADVASDEVIAAAGGDVQPYVGAVDAALMHSAAGIAGMVKACEARTGQRGTDEHAPLVGLTMFGVTTPATDEARAAGRAGLRGARLPRHRHGRPRDGEAGGVRHARRGLWRCARVSPAQR